MKSRGGVNLRVGSIPAGGLIVIMSGFFSAVPGMNFHSVLFPPKIKIHLPFRDQPGSNLGETCSVA